MAEGGRSEVMNCTIPAPKTLQSPGITSPSGDQTTGAAAGPLSVRSFHNDEGQDGPQETASSCRLKRADSSNVTDTDNIAAETASEIPSNTALPAQRIGEDGIFGPATQEAAAPPTDRQRLVRPSPTSYEQDDNMIDSALLAAMRDQRERVALLRLEQVMIDFMNTPDGYMEVGGPFNSVVMSPTFGMTGGNKAEYGRQTSFQRCWLHRLADRFSIVRENGSMLEGSIRLVKRKDSRIPKKLLIHVDASEYNPRPGDDSNSLEALAQNLSNTSINKPQGRQRKMKIMKRSSPNMDSSSRSSDNSRTPSASRRGKNLSDKEKAYAEARARIFSNQGGDGNVAALSPSNAASASSSSTPSPTATPPPSTPGPRFSRSASSSSLPPFTTDEDGSDGVVLSEEKRRSSIGGVNKATWRNRRQEENDPDFQRGAAVPVMMAPYNATGGMMDTAGGGYGYGAQYAQHYYAGAGQGYVPQQQHVDESYYGGGQQQSKYYQTSTVNGRGRGRAFGASRYPAGQEQAGRASTNVKSFDEFPALR